MLNLLSSVFKTLLCVCVCVCVSIQDICAGMHKAGRSPGNGFVSLCELPDGGAVNQT